MDRHTIEILEYEKVLGLLARYASSEMGIDRVLRLAPLEAISEIEARATMISEIKYLLEWGKSPPLSGIRDIRNTISRAKIPGTVLDAKALLATNSVVRSSRLTRAFFCENKERGGRLWGLASGLRELPDLEKAIDAAIDEDTNIRDEASPVLKRIRREKARISGRVASTLSGLLARESVQPYLQESIITIRNGRYVVPVRAEAKARLAGIVHDTSHSGATVFIEPMETVELNNALRSLELEEKDEIVKILSGLTDRVREGAGEISIDLEILAELDLIQAAARFSREFGCSRPEINPERRTVIKGGRHPILVEIERAAGGQSAVPLDVSIGGKKRCLLITGPNAGGKTVALKTIGIVTLLARTGLHVPCEDGTSVALFGRIYADIGDEQSIELSLSTFSSHMKNTIEILHSADRDSLILLDEVGAGTDPFEGSAIARAIIEELMETGATVVATTHHMSLKVFAHENQLLENASMEFDSDNLRPTYRLIQGVPGASHAFEIASRLGMSDRVLTKARSYCGDERVRFEELTKDLLDKMKKISAEQATVEVKRRKADETLMEYRKKLEEIKKHDRELRRKALKEAREVVEDAKRTVRGLVKELKEKETQPQRAKSIQKQIREESHKIKEAIQEIDEAGETRKPLGSVVVGARAYVRPLSKEGTVLTEPDEKGRLEVVVGSLRVEVGVADLLEPWGEAAPKSAGAVEFEAREVPGEIDVRGMTAEDAWEAVDRYLDDAALYGHPSVRVIHGKGKGVLSKRIKEMLTSHPRVGSHRFGDLAEGGAGVTIVEIEKG